MSMTAAIVGTAAAGAATGILDTGVSTWSAFEQQKRNFEEAERGREFEKYMASNKYQLAISDLQKAGLNPSLLFGSASGGASSSAPTGSSASSVRSSVGEKIMNSINTYLNYSLGKESNQILLLNSLKRELKNNSAKSERYDEEPNGGFVEI